MLLTDRVCPVEGEFTYPFKTRPFKHQLACWYATKDKPAYALFMSMGTGKSKVLIDTIAWLYDQGRINGAVIVAPKAVYRNWSDSELPAHMPAHIRYKVGIYAAGGKKQDRESVELLSRASDDDLHILLLNVESLGRDINDCAAYDALEAFLLGHRAMLAVDESTVIKNPKALRTKALLKARTLAPYRRILSGQPAVNGPLDLFSQCEFLDPALLGFSSFYSYKAHFAQLVPMKVTGPQGTRRTFNKIAGYRNLDDLNKILNRFAFIVKKEDCLDLPPKVFTRRAVDMGPQQKRAYEQMRKLAVATIERHLDERSGHVQQPLMLSPDQYLEYMQAGPRAEGSDCMTTVSTDLNKLATAPLVLTQRMRLHQILCGFLVTDDGKAQTFDEPNPRLEDLIATLAEVSGKAIIWATYKINVVQIAERIAKEYGTESVVTYYGPDSVDARREAIRRFQDPQDPCRFFISNKTGARGLTLTTSSTSIYYSYDHDLDTHDQSQDRNHRIGQKNSVTYVYQYAPGTVDESTLASLQSKQAISKQITPSNWRDFI